MKFEISTPDGGKFKAKTTKDGYVDLTVAYDDTSIRISLTKNEALALAERLIEHYEEEGEV